MLDKKSIPDQMIYQTPNEMAYSFARRVQKERILQRLTQKDLAIKTGLSFAAIARFEKTGEISLPKLMRILKTMKKVQIVEQLSNFDPIEANIDFQMALKRDALKKKKRVRKTDEEKV
jgi:transcriptional regulator with XRE-family HTH domain